MLCSEYKMIFDVTKCYTYYIFIYGDNGQLLRLKRVTRARKNWFLRIRDGRAKVLMDRKVIEISSFSFFSDYLPTYQPIFYISIYLSIYLSLSLSLFLFFICVVIYLSIYLFISLFAR